MEAWVGKEEDKNRAGSRLECMLSALPLQAYIQSGSPWRDSWAQRMQHDLTHWRAK